MLKYVMLVLVVVFGATLPAQANSFRAANGQVLPAPKLNNLTCDQMDQLMETYISSQYRHVEFLPTDHPDRPIYDYENKLAQRHYEDCQMGRSHFENAAPAFSKGFN